MSVSKKWLLGGVLLGGLGAVVMLRRRGGSNYEWDDIDSAGEGDAFGDRPADAPEQLWSAAETRTDVTPEQLSMAARVETSWEDIKTAWPTLSLDDVRKADGDLDRLSDMIAGKVRQPREQVLERLNGIIAQDTPMPSFPAQ